MSEIASYPDWTWVKGAYLTILDDRLVRIRIKGTGLHPSGNVLYFVDHKLQADPDDLWQQGFVESIAVTNDPDALRRSWDEIKTQIPERLMEEIL